IIPRCKTLKQEGAVCNSNSVYSIVCSHYLRQLLPFTNASVRAEIELPHAPIVHVGAACMPVNLGIVSNIVLTCRDCFEVPWIITHHTSDKTTSHLSHKEGIFGKSLCSSTPSGVSCRFYNWRPVS